MTLAPPVPTHSGNAPLVAQGAVAGWIAVGSGAAGAALLAARAAGFTPGPCLLLAHTGIACPGCGLTRLAVTLGHGDVSAALARDLPGTLLLVALTVAGVAQLASIRGRTVAWLGSGLLPLALVGLLVAHWALGIATSGFTT